MNKSSFDRRALRGNNEPLMHDQLTGWVTMDLIIPHFLFGYRNRDITIPYNRHCLYSTICKCVAMSFKQE